MLLNEKTKESKARDIQIVNNLYVTRGEVKDGERTTELKDDLILVTNFTYNTFIKKFIVSSNQAIAGLTVDLIMLDSKYEEFKKIEGITETVIAPLKAGINFATVLKNSDLDLQELKFITLGEKLESMIERHYQGEIKLAFKIKTGSSSAIKGAKILSEIDFITDR